MTGFLAKFVKHILPELNHALISYLQAFTHIAQANQVAHECCQ